MRTPSSASWVGIAVGLCTAVVVAVLVLTLFVVAQIRSVQETNSQSVATTAAIVKELRADESAQMKGDATVSQILIEAGKAVAQLETMEAAICKATPGCVTPTS